MGRVTVPIRHTCYAMRMLESIGFCAFIALAGCTAQDSTSPGDKNKTLPRGAFDMDRCYPYIVSKDYLPFQPDDGKGLVRPLGHGLFVLLVQDQDGVVQNVTPEDLEVAKLTAQSAHEKAIENLQRLFASG